MTFDEIVYTSKNGKVQSKSHRNCITFLESLYPEMYRKQFWLTFDKNVFSYKQKGQSVVKNVSNLSTFLESTYPEMQRKYIPRVYEYQSSAAIRLMIEIKH